MRIPRPFRWLLILVALVFGWLAGGYLQESRAERQWQQEMNAAPPTTKPATQLAKQRT